MNNDYIRVFRAFTDVNRVRVLELLCEGEMCACVLLDDLKISQPTLSHHMKILCETGIVKSRKVGKWSYYSIDEDGCRLAKRLLEAISKKQMHGALVVLIYLRRLFRRAFSRQAHESARPQTL